jgi:hypothetical protein
MDDKDEDDDDDDDKNTKMIESKTKRRLAAISHVFFCTHPSTFLLRRSASLCISFDLARSSYTIRGTDVVRMMYLVLIGKYSCIFSFFIPFLHSFNYPKPTTPTTNTTTHLARGFVVRELEPPGGERGGERQLGVRPHLFSTHSICRMGGSDAFLKRLFGAAEAKGAKGERTAVKVKLLQPALLVSCLLWVW